MLAAAGASVAIHPPPVPPPPPSVDTRRHGVRGVVIDPYNEVSHARQREVSETDFVSVLLSKVKRFAQQ